MRKFNLALSLVLAFVLSRPNAHGQISSQFAQRMQTVMDSACAKMHLKGASVAVTVPGAGVWKGTYGLANAAGDKVKEDMYFGIGSNTKTFTAVILLKLQEQGLLSLDDTIGKWIKPHPYIKGSITIRQMLNHTSSLYSFTEYDYFNDSLLADLERVWKPEEMLPFIQQPYSPISGKSFRYSNTNYLLAGIIIEAVTHKPYETVLREQILEPYGLKNTYFYPQEKPSGIIANPWSMGMGQRYLVDGITVGYSNTAFFSLAWAAGAVVSTAEDNSRFWHLLSSGQMLKESSWKEMRGWVPAGSGAAYGLGIFRYSAANGRKCFAHGGTMVGYINENLIDSASGICISLLTNQDSLGNGYIFNNLVLKLHKVTLNTKATAIADASASNLQADIYPNPAIHSLTITLPATSGPATLMMYDLSGRPVLSQSIAGNSCQLDISQLPAGLYMAHIRSSEGMAVKRVQVVR